MSREAVAGTFVALAASASFNPHLFERGDNDDQFCFNISLWGAFTATVIIERSFDNGATWLQLTALGQPLAFTAAMSEPFEESQPDVLWRLRCSAFTSGTVNYLISK